MSDITAKLAGTTLNDVKGLTEDRAASMFANLGSTHLAIVELKVCEHTDSVDDKDKVLLKVLHLEFADDDVAAHLRDLSQAIYRGRTPTQLTIDSNLDEVEPSADEIVERGKQRHEELLAGKTDLVTEEDAGNVNGVPEAEWSDGYPEGAKTEPAGVS